MEDEILYKHIGCRIVEERKFRAYTQEDLAFLCNMDRTYLARIESGKANPSIRVLNKISRKLRVKIYELLWGL